MLRISLISLVVLGILAAPAVSTTPAFACGIVKVPTNTPAELAAIRKALPKAKLTSEDKEKVEKLLAEARKANLPKADREKAISGAMKMLDLPRIFQDEACITIKVPLVS